LSSVEHAAAAIAAAAASICCPCVPEIVRCLSRSCCIPASATIDGLEDVTVLFLPWPFPGADLSESDRGRVGNVIHVSGELDTVCGVSAVVRVVDDDGSSPPAVPPAARTVGLVIVRRRCAEPPPVAPIVV
jgi:hypothetical protein